MNLEAKPSSFISKFHSILKNKSYEAIIKYDQPKAKIIIFDKTQLQQEILPHFFRHGKFSSFIRQLNLYGFKKIKNSEVECFTHPNLENKQKFLSIIAKKKVNKEDQEDAQQISANQPKSNLEENSHRRQLDKDLHLNEPYRVAPLVSLSSFPVCNSPYAGNYSNLSVWNSWNFQNNGLTTVFMPIPMPYQVNSFDNYLQPNRD